MERNPNYPWDMSRNDRGVLDDMGLSDQVSPIFDLGSIDLPWSFPFDIMHLFYENITQTFLRVMLGDGYKHGKDIMKGREQRSKLKETIVQVNGALPRKMEKFPLELFQFTNSSNGLNYMKAVNWKAFVELFPLFFLYRWQEGR